MRVGVLRQLELANLWALFHTGYDARPQSEPAMAKDIENPCVSLCQLNSELCVSCGRTREEIRKWRGMKRPEKMATVQRAATRMKAISKKNAKRQGSD